MSNILRERKHLAREVFKLSARLSRTASIASSDTSDESDAGSGIESVTTSATGTFSVRGHPTTTVEAATARITTPARQRLSRNRVYPASPAPLISRPYTARGSETEPSFPRQRAFIVGQRSPGRNEGERVGKGDGRYRTDRRVPRGARTGLEGRAGSRLASPTNSSLSTTSSEDSSSDSSSSSNRPSNIRDQRRSCR